MSEAYDVSSGDELSARASAVLDECVDRQGRGGYIADFSKCLDSFVFLYETSERWLGPTTYHLTKKDVADSCQVKEDDWRLLLAVMNHD